MATLLPLAHPKALSKVGAALLLLVVGVVGGCKKTVSLPADPLPQQILFSKEELKDGFLNYTITPLKRVDLHFTMLVPIDWKEEPVVVGQKQMAEDDVELVPLAKFAPKKDSASAQMTVSYLRLRHEMNLSDYVETFAAENDIAVKARRRVKVDNVHVDELFAVVTNAERQAFTRLTFRKDGPHIFLLVSGSLPDRYERWSKHFAAAALSLRVLPGSDEEFAERMTTFEASPFLGINLRVPASWQPQIHEDAPEGHGGVDLVLPGDAVSRAVVRVKWAEKAKVPEADAKQMGEVAFDELVDSGVQGTSFLGRGKIPGVNPPGAEVQLWSGQLADSEVVLRSAHFDGPRAVYSVSSVAPAKTQDPEGWAAAAKVFELAAQDVATSAH